MDIQSEFSSDEDNKQELSPLIKKSKQLSQLIETDKNQEIVRVGTIKFNLNTLKQTMSIEKVKYLYQNINQLIISNDTDELLQYIPIIALPSVKEYHAQSYRLKVKHFRATVFNTQTKITPTLIAHINFPNLQILKINNSEIHNVQTLTWIQAPNLRCLELYRCNISNLNTLVKADFPKLEIITFYHNPITSIQKLCRFHSKKLTGFQFDNKNTYKDRVQDYRFLFKMQNPHVKMLKVQDEKRIDLRNRPAFKILNQPGVKILYHQQNRYNRRPHHYNYEEQDPDDYIHPRYTYD